MHEVPSLSLVMIARNEESNIKQSLAHAAKYVDEMIVVDTGSTDRTREIAVDCGAQVHRFDWCHDFSAARNFALSCSKSDWNLILDADECVTEMDLRAIRTFMTRQQAVGRVRMVSHTVAGDERQETTNYITRLIPKGVQYAGRIHEQIVTSLPRVNVPIVVEHSGYIQGSKADRNIPLLLEEIKTNPTDPYYHYHIAKEYQGIEDWEYTRDHMQKAYQRLTGSERYAPNVTTDYLYLLIKLQLFEQGLALIDQQHAWVSAFPDYFFACGTFYLDLVIDQPEKYLSLLPRVETSYLRCLQIGETDRYDSVAGTGSYAALYNLGNYYEVMGNRAKAVQCFQQSAQLGYKKAEMRLTSAT